MADSDGRRHCANVAFGGVQVIAARWNLNAAMGDRASGAECVLRHLDPVGLQPCLVFSLRFGQRGRLGQAGRTDQHHRLELCLMLLGHAAADGRLITVYPILLLRRAQSDPNKVRREPVDFSVRG